MNVWPLNMPRTFSATYHSIPMAKSGSSRLRDSCPTEQQAATRCLHGCCDNAVSLYGISSFSSEHVPTVAANHVVSISPAKSGAAKGNGQGCAGCSSEGNAFRLQTFGWIRRPSSPSTLAIMRRARGLRVRPLLPPYTPNGSWLTLAGFFTSRHLHLLCHPSTGYCEPCLVAHSLCTVETAQLVEQIISICRGCRLQRCRTFATARLVSGSADAPGVGSEHSEKTSCASPGRLSIVSAQK